jgi:DNA-binding FadR family transcriptional regulator
MAESGGTTLLQREEPARLSAGVYEGIVKLIARGDFALNTRLPSEVKLSAMFAASRPVVREALARLREDGVIVSRQGSGSYVRKQPDMAVLELAPVGSLGDVQRCFEFRAGLEPIAAGLAATRWEAEDMQNIESCMEALERCLSSGILGVYEDQSLHEAIADATHNQYYATVQRQLRPHITAGMSVTRSLTLRRTGEHLRIVQDEHSAIIKALRQRDGDTASALMRSHILNARQRMFEGIE